MSSCRSLRGRIIGMMDTGWSSRRVPRQLGRSDSIVRRCWDQWIREMSFTRRPGSGDALYRPVVEKTATSSDDNRVRVWRPRSERLNPAFALQRHTTPIAGVMWYVHDVLQPHVLPLMQRLPGAIFQQDNARSHTARVSQDCLRTVITLPWPARSPDLSPIEHI
ncbi:transposable element Tcb2 transposase [Trichonephila clavipes]|nr:transposable element Tcb2 transposase [Trichonephila clavipes]